MNRDEVVARTRSTGIIAIMRHTEATRAIETAEALLGAGVEIVEVTMNTAGALGMIAALGKHFGDRIVVGAGTVMSVDAAREAVDAGAQILVSPHLDVDIVVYAVESGIAVVPGAFTPTEIFRGWSAGASFVKVFPAGPVGPRYIKDVLAPLNQVSLIPTGGVNLDNAAEFIRAGAAALGLGSALVDPKLVGEGKYEQIATAARGFRAAVQVGRAKQ